MRYYHMLMVLLQGSVLLCSVPATYIAIQWDAGVGGLLFILGFLAVGLSSVLAAIVIPLVNIAENLEKLTETNKNVSQKSAETAESNT